MDWGPVFLSPCSIGVNLDDSAVKRKNLDFDGNEPLALKPLKNFGEDAIFRPLYPGELGEDAVEVFRFGDFVGWIIEG